MFSIRIFFFFLKNHSRKLTEKIRIEVFFERKSQTSGKHKKIQFKKQNSFDSHTSNHELRR